MFQYDSSALTIIVAERAEYGRPDAIALLAGVQSHCQDNGADGSADIADIFDRMPEIE
jgi:hypothetical protein